MKNVLNLDGIWDFFFDASALRVPETLPEILWETGLSVPGCFDVTEPRIGKRGVGFYRRIVRIRDREEADDITDELIDRYGDPPKGVTNLITIALLRAQAKACGITEILQKETLRFTMPKPDFQKVAQVCSDPKYKGRLLFAAGEKPHLALRLKKGDDVLKLAALVLKDFAQPPEE